MTLETKHPFEQHGRVFAHNGCVGDLATLESRLGEHRKLVQGDTDSERLFALVTREIEARDGDVGEGIVAAVRWVAESLPMHSVNCVSPHQPSCRSLRYPDTHRLMMLERVTGGTLNRCTGSGSTTWTLAPRSPTRSSASAHSEPTARYGSCRS